MSAQSRSAIHVSDVRVRGTYTVSKCWVMRLGRHAGQAEIVTRGMNCHVGIAAKAKLRRAVQHARLATHQEASYVVRADRRKDFVNRARDQEILQARGK
jgi:hypothetical protein